MEPVWIALAAFFVVGGTVIVLTTALNLRTFRRTGRADPRAVRFMAVYAGASVLIVALVIGGIIVARGLWLFLPGLVPMVVVAIALMRARVPPPSH